MISQNRKPKWLFYPGWVVLSSLSIPIAWLISLAIISQIERAIGGRIEVAGRSHITEDFFFSYIFFPMLGLVTGFLQYLLLRHYLPRMGWWIVATVLGLLLGFAVVYLSYAIMPVALNPNSTWFAMLVFVSVGTAMGLAQWLVLRRWVPRPGWWILASVLGWVLARLIAGEVFTSLWELVLIGAIPAAIMGLTMWWLLSHLLQHAIAESL